jgi:hypothetical protein
MTESVEQYVQQAFQQDAERAPSARNLAQSARARARAQRRRQVASAAGALLAVTVATTVLWHPWGNHTVTVQPARAVVEPNYTGGLTREECPKNSAGMTGGFYGERSTMPPAEQQAREMGSWMALDAHPDATLVPGLMTAESAEYLYVLPDGNRVARLEFEWIEPYGWYLKGAQYC